MFREDIKVILMDRKYGLRLTLLIGFLLLLVLIVFLTTIGTANISFVDTMRIICQKIPFLGSVVSGEGINEVHSMIVLKVRLPRLIAAAVIGMGLSVSGAAYQGMFVNPLADPYVLGVSSGAALGAAIAIAAGFESSVGGFGIAAVAAFVFSILTIFIVFGIAKTGTKISNTNLLLSGVAVGNFALSVIAVIMVLNRDRVDKIVFWTLGSVSTASWNQLVLLVPIVTCGVILILIYARDLNIIASGEDEARSLGVEVESVKKILLLICSLIVAACVSVGGIIGFVGLIIPHTIRLVTGSDNRLVLPFSAVGGAIFLIVCDTLARSVVSPAEIPVGALTSMFGAPFFIFLLMRRKKRMMI